MTQKHLHELLKQDQEPFTLKTFISDRRTLLNPTVTATGKVTGKLTGTTKTAVVVKKPKPITESKSLTNFCIKNACFLPLNDSPSFKTSPFLDFPPRELKSPCKDTTVFLHIPTTLLDAATRVQKPKPGSECTKLRFGLLGSLLRRLKDRSVRAKRREIEPIVVVETETTSCSLRSVVCEFDDENECLCSESSSPFRFSLKRSPSPDRRKMDDVSPVVSPSCRFQQDKESLEVGCPEENNRQNDDEKEQCSPVSVLDPMFDDDEEERDDGAAEEDSYDIERSYANVQRAKHQLLQKLKRFERLAELDPIQLENRMLEQCYDEEEEVLANEEEVTHEECFKEIVNHLGVAKVPWYLKKLIVDLIEEEKKKEENEMVVQRVCERLCLWKVVELNTIDMIVETDFRNEGWKRCDEETIKDIGIDIEKAVLEFLVDELAQELVF